MSSFAQKTYLYAVHNQGRYTFLLVGLSVLTLPLFQPELLIGVPLFVTLLGAAMALVLVKPALQPRFLRLPQGFVQGFGAMFASNIIFLLAMMLGYLAVLNMGLEEPLSRQIAILTALPTLAMTGVMWWSALALMFAAPPADNTPKGPPQAHTPSSEELLGLV